MGQSSQPVAPQTLRSSAALSTSKPSSGSRQGSVPFLRFCSITVLAVLMAHISPECRLLGSRKTRATLPQARLRLPLSFPLGSGLSADQAPFMQDLPQREEFAHGKACSLLSATAPCALPLLSGPPLIPGNARPNSASAADGSLQDVRPDHAHPRSQQLRCNSCHCPRRRARPPPIGGRRAQLPPLGHSAMGA
jgi:hypothetical protein